ncbi:hypothetical protein Clacol_007955 [Clathrus columnatus]|uniref:Alpha/beta hydrolase fold-3 domain-containing protein n=1 Tax=Clathrus columnatus TaxID=1419009 RepID=A0AAV5AKN9_9AGAM|nr:hypothetical protein Clacol_007955 [Clathrus columnatus]
MAQYAHLSDPDPEWAAVSANLPLATPLVSFQTLREEVAAFRAKLDLKTKKVTDGLKVVERMIQVENGEIRARAYIPDSQEDNSGFPLMVWMFGGGFVIGSIDDDDAFLRNLAVNSKIVCVGGDYRKAPEHPFPAAVNDSYASLKWALNNSSEFSIDASKGVIVGGVSAGGNLAAVLAHKSSKDPELGGRVTGQLLVMPVIIAPQAYPDKFKSELLSLDKDEDKYMLTKSEHIQCTGKTMIFRSIYQYITEYYFIEAYHCNIHAINPDVSPILAESFEGLPPAYIQIAGLDILRDEAFLYERLLKEAGVLTKVDVFGERYAGLPHGFHVDFKDLEETKRQERDFVDGLDWLLNRK